MSRNEIILTVAAGALVGFSLIVSILVPRWRPDFPGRRTGLFAVVAALFVLGMLGAVEVFGSEEHGEAAAETVGETTTTTGTDTGASTTDTNTGGQIKAGEAVFASAGCGSCHVLASAGSTGTVGPNLDELQPSLDAVASQVTDGGGGMPAFAGQLSDEEIQAVAAYVVDSTGR